MQHTTRHTRTIGIRAAARALARDPATISRYVAANPVLNHGSTGRPRVDLDELRRHRAANLNPAPRGRQAAKLLAEAEAPLAAGPVGDSPPPAATRTEAPPNYAHAKAVRETVLAQRARIDLDEKRGLLVPIAEVQDAAYEAGAVLQRDLLDLAGQLSEIIAPMTDATAIAALVESEHRRLLAAFAASLRADAAAEEAAKAAATGEVIPIDERRP
ncbi:MAG: hypothetical protein O7I42_01370 [Alphaproteobacteria bacterium]|nr:hypothetical protein [Alphaproteobacteria bacterium]